MMCLYTATDMIALLVYAVSIFFFIIITIRSILAYIIGTCTQTAQCAFRWTKLHCRRK